MKDEELEKLENDAHAKMPEFHKIAYEDHEIHPHTDLAEQTKILKD